ncbi:hypothetical protein [Pseudanabaena sp. FACHB-2040]|uniref:hypothetical protein n=1 Tax=Pseudanabaena sp. FACHB-2040 TaxID=2692859 RepID=UPI0016843265|nr:hypothetical protein [Pseudanabaena sp. FACHB-2040]MBD2259563.1 hypothetical protein [Pseudanabaena sp. FACHB-2040]
MQSHLELKGSTLKKVLPLSLLLLLIPMASCRVEQEEAGSLPDVDVEVEPGSLPEYDVQGPDVNVGVTERTITVPKVIVVQEEETVEVPYIDVNVPGAERQERTITVEVEAPSSGYNVEIQDVYSVNNELWVVSQLAEVNPNAPQATARVADRIVVNAPDIPVRHYIVGERPLGSFNEQYTFVGTREQINSQLEAGRQLYDREQPANS